MGCVHDGMVSPHCLVCIIDDRNATITRLRRKVKLGDALAKAVREDMIESATVCTQYPKTCSCGPCKALIAYEEQSDAD